MVHMQCMYYSVTLCFCNDGIFLEAFAAACVRARLSTITATNKLRKVYIYIYLYNYINTYNIYYMPKDVLT